MEQVINCDCLCPILLKTCSLQKFNQKNINEILGSGLQVRIFILRNKSTDENSYSKGNQNNPSLLEQYSLPALHNKHIF